MNAELEYHKEAVYLLPCILLATAKCECCEEVAGTQLTLSWGFWSLHLLFGFDEDSHNPPS